jgi:2-keto-4-pentenoate hydratase/2-oxohepta-3-ene-1,7-dioic acid hydratase in catechol pathway
MRLVRFGEQGKEKPGLLYKEKSIVDLSSVFQDIDSKFLSNGAIKKINDLDLDSLPQHDISSVRLGQCVANPSKIVCVGLNYLDHAKETNLATVDEPIIFLKATSALNGPNDEVKLPRNSHKTDWEAELAVVIGKKASYVSEEEAMDYVYGYTIMNDYSEREFQIEKGSQWTKGKCCDTFAPLGPAIVTKDEIEDVNNLSIWLKVNGELKQNGSTKDLNFKIPFLISYISQFMTLYPGDIISTGTPSGSGIGQNPPQFLKKGDKVELGIEGLGMQVQTIVQ